MVHLIVTGIIVPEDIGQPLWRVELDSEDVETVNTMESIIGGHFVSARLKKPAASFWYDSEGRDHTRLINQRATLVRRFHTPDWREDDSLLGDVLITGFHKDGKMRSAPKKLLTLFFEAERFRVEGQMGSSKRWCISDRRYSDWMDAYNDALHMVANGRHMKNVRVVPA